MEKRKTLVWLPLIDLAESKLAHETLAVELCHLMYFLAKVAMKAAHMKVPNIAFALAMTRYTQDVNSYFPYPGVTELQQ